MTPAPLAEPEDLASYLQRDLDRATAELMLDGASGLVRAYCGWELTQATEQRTVAGNGTSVLRLPTLLLRAVSEVRLYGDVVTEVDWTTQPVMAPEEYTWTHPGLLFRLAGWPERVPVQVSYIHGYAEVPADVRLIALSVAARLLANPESLRARTLGSVSQTFEPGGAGLTDLEAALLDGYRL